MKRLWAKLKSSPWGRLLAGLGLIHLIEDTLEDILLATIARFLPVPIWALYAIIVTIALVIVVIFTYVMAKYAWKIANHHEPEKK